MVHFQPAATTNELLTSTTCRHLHTNQSRKEAASQLCTGSTVINVFHHSVKPRVCLRLRMYHFQAAQVSCFVASVIGMFAYCLPHAWIWVTVQRN